MTTVQIDPKHTIIINKVYAAIGMTMFSVLIALTGYIYVTDQSVTRKQMEQFQDEQKTRDYRLERLMLHTYAITDVVQKLHPEDDIPSMVFQAQLRYKEWGTTRGGKAEAVK